MNAAVKGNYDLPPSIYLTKAKKYVTNNNLMKGICSVFVKIFIQQKFQKKDYIFFGRNTGV